MNPYILAAGAYVISIFGYIAHLKSGENEKEIDKLQATIEKMQKNIEALEESINKR